MTPFLISIPQIRYSLDKRFGHQQGGCNKYAQEYQCDEYGGKLTPSTEFGLQPTEYRMDGDCDNDSPKEEGDKWTQNNEAPANQ